MPRNSSGVYTEPSGTRAVSGAVASSTAFNDLIDDLGDALTDSLTANGDKVWTGDQDANGHTITDLQTPVDATDAATKGYVDGASGLSSKMAAIDSLTWITDSILWFTSASTVGCAAISDFGRSLINDATAADARATLELGNVAVEDTINNGNWSGTDLAVANGGTGASDAATARTNLEIAPYTSSDVDYDAFAIGTCVMVDPGGSTPSRNSLVSVYRHANGEQYVLSVVGSPMTGAWRCRGHAGGSLLVQRVA